MTDTPDPSSSADLRRLDELADLMTPTVLRVAVTIGIPEVLHGHGPLTAAEVARRTGGEPTAIEVVLGHLAVKGIVERRPDATFVLSELGALTLPSADNGFHDHLDLRHGSGHMATALPGLLHAVEHGGSAYEAVHGRSFWDAMGADEELGSSFDRHLARWADRWAPGIAALPVWAELDLVVDVGGGSGVLATALAAAHPTLSVTIVELEATAERARAVVRERGFDGRVSITPGSFFDPLPAGDAYVLAQILHDWPDPDARRILARCAEALPVDGRLMIAERLPDASHDGAEDHAEMSVLMLSLFGARERDVADYERLLGEVGLELVATHRPDGGLSLLAARRQGAA